MSSFAEHNEERPCRRGIWTKRWGSERRSGRVPAPGVALCWPQRGPKLKDRALTSRVFIFCWTRYTRVNCFSLALSTSGFHWQHFLIPCFFQYKGRNVSPPFFRAPFRFKDFLRPEIVQKPLQVVQGIQIKERWWVYFIPGVDCNVFVLITVVPVKWNIDVVKYSLSNHYGAAAFVIYILYLLTALHIEYFPYQLAQLSSHWVFSKYPNSNVETCIM